MSVIDVPPDREATAATPVPRSPVPSPRFPPRKVSAPAALLFAGGLAVWGVATWLALTGRAPAWATIPPQAAVTCTMFAVLHESVHHSAGRLTWVNETLGRLAMPFVAGYGSFPMVRAVHLEHHRHTNAGPDHDPDGWATRGKWWQLPARWLTIDLAYARFYLARADDRPHAEITETMATLTLCLGGFAGVLATGHGWQLLLVYLIPQRIGLALVAWWFAWLPHHGLPCGHDRVAATRMRVGLEWLLTPLLLGQNYHLVHHLHPTVPFHRYPSAWRASRAAYLRHDDLRLATPWGRDLTAREYRDRRNDESTGAPEPCALPACPDVPRPRERAEFHALTVTGVEELTGDAVAVTFAVPGHLRETFSFVPGQHLTLKSTVDDERRTYALCGLPWAGTLRIAVTHGPHAALRPGDTVEAMPPSGEFTLAPRPGAGRHYVALAAGIGITPILSMLPSVLLAEPDSQATLLYVNRSGASTLFAGELSEWARRFEGRLRVLHYRTDERDPDLHPARTRPWDAIGEALAISFERYHSGKLDGARVRALMNGRLHPAKVDEWLLSGSASLVGSARNVLLQHDVPEETIHCALFHADETCE